MSKLKKVLIMAGGTGGHVFPGLAVANVLKENGVQVEWLGTEKGLESRLVPDAGIRLHKISIQGLRGKGLKSLITAPWKLTKAIFQSIAIIRQVNPDVILGMGGFVSGPGGIASWFLRKSLVIHEQNAKAGLTNRWLAPFSQKVLEGFPQTFTAHSKIITTGNPVRSEILNLPAPEKRFQEMNRPLRLLIIGGSLGAAAINQVIPEVLAQLPVNERPDVYHQTGEKNLKDTMDAYNKANVGFTMDAAIRDFSAKKTHLTAFITNMAEAYGWADVILCRAGALTIAELCAVGVGAILVPFPFAVDDHQTANAQFMVRNQAAWLIQQKDLTSEKLLTLIQDLNLHREKCFLMAQSAYKSRKIDAAEQVYKICEEICP